MCQDCSKLDKLTDEVLRRLPEKLAIPVEVSGRHVHLKQEHVDILFGIGHKLTPNRSLSQPGQYLCEERVTLKTEKGMLKNVAVLGPTRQETQVELSQTDAAAMNVDAPVKESGDLNGSAPITILSENGEVRITEGAIVALRHLHITPEDAKYLGLRDRDRISVRIDGLRPLVFEDVLVRMSENSSTTLHVDYDEANACGYCADTKGSILR